MKAMALIIASIAISAAAVGQQATVRGNGAAQSGGSATVAGAAEMNATLERSVDARRAKPGDAVTAKTNHDFTTEAGASIPRGTKLVGRVTQARPHARGAAAADSASQLGIVFDKAVLRDGREVPMRATIQAVAAAQSNTQGRVGSASHDAGAFGAAGGGAAGGSLGGALGGLGGAVDAGGGFAGSAAGVVGGAARAPRAVGNAAASSAANAATQGSAALGSSAGAIGGLSASGQWLAGSRGAFGLGDLDIASAAAGSAQGSLITSASRHVRLDGGTQLLLVGSAGAAAR